MDEIVKLKNRISELQQVIEIKNWQIDQLVEFKNVNDMKYDGERDLLFSVTAKDCEWDYYRGTGAGGQKKNKTSSAVRCRHKESGAIGQCEDTRSQHKNKITAFVRMTETKEFKDWHKLEVSRRLGVLDKIKDSVEFEIKHNTKIEKKVDGKWVDWNDE